MKIPLQDKIAELESRIAALEALSKRKESMSFSSMEMREGFGNHWSSLWQEFESLMKDVFGRAR